MASRPPGDVVSFVTYRAIRREQARAARARAFRVRLATAVAFALFTVGVMLAWALWVIQ